MRRTAWAHAIRDALGHSPLALRRIHAIAGTGLSDRCLRYDGGIAIVAENASSTLCKVSEIYDRTAFAGVGRYNELDPLRIAGVRHVDLKAFALRREDVDT